MPGAYSDRSDEELLREFSTPRHRLAVRLGTALGGLALLCGGCVAPLLAVEDQVHKAWLLLGPLLASGLCLGVHAFWRSLPKQRAFFARFHPGLDEAIRRAQERVAAEPEPHYVALFLGNVLPHGGRRWVRLDAAPGGSVAVSVEAAAMDYLWEEAPGERVSREERAIEGSRAQELCERILATATSKVATVGRNPVRDGLPFDLVVVGPDPEQVQRVSGNLAAVANEERDAPAVRLAHSLLALSTELTGRPSVMGSCDARGKVVITEV